MVNIIDHYKGDNSKCHEDSRCHEEGYHPYVCSKKPLVSDRAIAAYRKAIEGTTIYKNASDYAQVFTFVSVVNVVSTVHVSVKNVTRVSSVLPNYTNRSIWYSKHCYHQLITSI